MRLSDIIKDQKYKTILYYAETEAELLGSKFVIIGALDTEFIVRLNPYTSEIEKVYERRPLSDNQKASKGKIITTIVNGNEMWAIYELDTLPDIPGELIKYVMVDKGELEEILD
ncbi:hypothetical protein HS7_19530 [Sulfolobales archaeon HS-7]|nr:hypothetical protein HS7_19530 [Sulfolobales archaeon HS-7]